MKYINIPLKLVGKKEPKNFKERIKYALWESPYIWETTEDIVVKLSNGRTIVITKGYKTDLSSVPRFLWWPLPPFGLFLKASIVHDYIYSEDLFREEMGDKLNKEFADKEMLILSEKLNPEGSFDNYARYYGVKYFGGSVYKRKKEESEKKKKRNNFKS